MAAAPCFRNTEGPGETIFGLDTARCPMAILLLEETLDERLTAQAMVLRDVCEDADAQGEVTRNGDVVFLACPTG